MTKTFLIDYDLYLARKYLAAAGLPVKLPQAVPISANAPEDYRVYFAAPTGEIILGIYKPAAHEILYLKAMDRPEGAFFIFVFKGPHLIDVVNPSAETVVDCLSVFAERNVLRPSFPQEFSRIVSLWREELLKVEDSTPASASDEDILDLVYRGSS